jgi:hypothetical protein
MGRRRLLGVKPGMVKTEGLDELSLISETGYLPENRAKLQDNYNVLNECAGERRVMKAGANSAADDTPFQNTKNGSEAAMKRRSHIRAGSLEPKAPSLLSVC